MTIKSRGTGSLAVSEVNTEAGRSATAANTGLKFLNDTVRSDQRAANPNMNTFYGLAYYQRYMDGNCDNASASNCNCNCGNIQCNNCANCTAINCANCDTQSWLQANCNAASQPVYNCTSESNCYSYNCNCNCSKIICTKLYEIGMMPRKIFVADQEFGNRLRETDPEVYEGYVRWASVIVAGMEGRSPDFMFWYPKDVRKQAEQESTINWAYKVAKPWSEHMAYLMGVVPKDNNVGRIIMKLGRPLSRLVNKLPKDYNFGFFGVVALWFICPALYYTAVAVDKIQSIFKAKDKEVLV